MIKKYEDLDGKQQFLHNCIIELLGHNADGLSVNWLAWKLRTTETDIKEIVETIPEFKVTANGNVMWI